MPCSTNYEASNYAVFCSLRYVIPTASYNLPVWLLKLKKYTFLIAMHRRVVENIRSVRTYCGNAISQMACLWQVICRFTSNVSKSIVKISLRAVPTNTVVFCSCRDVGVQSTFVDFNCIINKERARLYAVLLCKLYHPATGEFSVFCYYNTCGQIVTWWQEYSRVSFYEGVMFSKIGL